MDMVDDSSTPAEPATNLAEVAVDLTLGLLSVGASSLRELPDLMVKVPIRAASVALVAAERAQRDYTTLRVRGAEVRERISGALADRFLPPEIIIEDPGPVDPFDLLLTDGSDQGALPQEPRVVPLIVVTDDEEDPQPSGGIGLDELDGMSLGTLRGRARNLSIPELETLLDHERTHARREGHLALLETRIAQLHQEQSTG